MAGSLYIWIMLGFFALAVGIVLLLMGAFWVGHLIERKETGATHGFLELPTELRQANDEAPSSSSAEKDSPASNSPPDSPSA